MRLKGKILRINTLSDSHKERMLELMTLYYDGVDRADFNNDLLEKDWVLILEDCISNQIQGFSTLMLLETVIDRIPVMAIFSGDTIIHKEYWGEPELAKVWLDFIVSLIKQHKGKKFYWFLIVMGYKTYRFLPVYFHEFYPRYDKKIPVFEKRVVDAFGHLKYPQEYDKNSGVLHHKKLKARLKGGVADITNQRLKNPHISFFVKQNPLYKEGDELACITELTLENLKPIAFKVMSK